MDVDWITVISVAFGAVTIAFISFVLIGAIVGAVENESNHIETGVVVDKNHRSSYTSVTRTGNSHHYTVHPDRYNLCIEGEKDGETVKYWFSVTSGKYEMYQIGDTYP